MFHKQKFPNVDISISKSPNPVTQGYHVLIEGYDPEVISTIITSKYTSEVNDKFKIRRPYNHPPIPKPDRVNGIASIVEKSNESQSTNQSSKSVLQDITETEDEIKYAHIKLTRKEVTYIIGRGGTKIEYLRKTSQATIKIIPLNSLMNQDTLIGKTLLQYIRISGTAHQIKTAKRLIEDEIYQFRLGGITFYQ
ncbi:Meiotic recombination 1 protein [Wickerhamomyces ciferrii]|uniref:Meiotic recombination 1 protein n=1 Tax=Wickerhamomyces ciferrii (strain ATCC 14091 / BCRC 22168 / CBS 111 / JCM 3599 / NBRC 0793 / NRRL Y-1031 F-60-10) TaxID=1206466 RepID=K0KI54_WICCF|nr:Meiotic recombination 1 protein [Wickerhamomyces ciferrii]CCH41842.1 Meiotic recombination 1 protein [Wickerhamomyces ciferrii]